MKVLIFGASGFSGKAILDETLKQGHEVTILVRDKTRIKTNHENLIVIEGDVMNAKTIALLLSNKDAIIQCLGIGGKGDGNPNSFVSNATKLIVEEMEKQGCRRLISLSNVGAGNSIAFLPWFFTKIILPYFMKWLKVIIDDKNRMEPIIMNSNLDWTIVRCPNIIDKPAQGKCNATLDGKALKLSVTLGDMATFVVNQLVEPTFSKQAPSISN